jgi:signal transduction histidine kinase
MFVVPRAAVHFHWMAMAALALGCMALGLVQVERGMAALKRLRNRLALVRDGREARIAGEYPSEVQPLVDEVNALLDQRERAIARARSSAGDLAHGLKTPLAVLSQVVAGAAPELHKTAVVAQQVDRMRRQIDYHLARARAAASGPGPAVRSPVQASVEALCRTLAALHGDRRLTFDVAVDSRHAVRVGREDLDEMLGNLLDNACKWTRTRVAVRSAQTGVMVDVTIDDDGPGIAADLREAVLQRGIRADEAAPGSGLGLAIVRELAEQHQGAVALTESPAGGARARLTLPSAAP